MTSTIDRDVVCGIVDNDGDLLNELRQLLAADCEAHFRRLAAAIDSGDTAHAREVAHALKGAFANFGETAAWRRACDLERRLREDADIVVDRETVAALERANRELLDALDSLSNELRGG